MAEGLATRKVAVTVWSCSYSDSVYSPDEFRAVRAVRPASVSAELPPGATEAFTGRCACRV